MLATWIYARVGRPSGRLEPAPTPAIAKQTDLVQLRPFPQKWPGGTADGPDCFWLSWPRSNELQLTNVAVSPETAWRSSRELRLLS